MDTIIQEPSRDDTTPELERLQAENRMLRAQRDWWYESYGLLLGSELRCEKCGFYNEFITRSSRYEEAWRQYSEVCRRFDGEPLDGKGYGFFLREVLDERMEEEYTRYVHEYGEDVGEDDNI